MDPKEYIHFLNVIEKLKCNTRHSWTSSGRRESVAEHSWRIAVMAMLCEQDLPELDMNKVIKMCLIHDWGEAITGDIPAFDKTKAHEAVEAQAIAQLLTMLPESMAAEYGALFTEMDALQTPESKLFKSLDNMEALVSHNEADISTWTPKEYEYNLIYGDKNCSWCDWTQTLRDELRVQCLEKIEREAPRGDEHA